jgi:hypothetical protein
MTAIRKSRTSKMRNRYEIQPIHTPFERACLGKKQYNEVDERATSS